MEKNGFNSSSNYRMKFDLPKRYSANNLEFRPIDLENRNPNSYVAPWRAPSRKYQLRRYVGDTNLKRGRSRYSYSYKNHFDQLHKKSQKVDQQLYPPLMETKWTGQKKRKMQAAYCSSKAKEQALQSAKRKS